MKKLTNSKIKNLQISSREAIPIREDIHIKINPMDLFQPDTFPSFLQNWRTSPYTTGLDSSEDLWDETLQEIDGLPDYINDSESIDQDSVSVSNQMKVLLNNIQKNNIRIPNFSDIQNYLSSHNKLSNKLPKICTYVIEEFGKDSEITLDLYNDPEIDDEHLCFYVRQFDYDQGLMKRIRIVSKEIRNSLKGLNVWVDLTSDGAQPMG